MPRIDNTTEIPEVSADFHLLRIDAIELVEGTKYNEPDVEETRVKMTLRVMTQGEPEVTFQAWMSQNLGEKATLGSIYRAITGSKPGKGIDTDELLGRSFRHMVTHNENGWPKLVSGTAAATKHKSHALVGASVGADDDGVEPPF